MTADPGMAQHPSRAAARSEQAMAATRWPGRGRLSLPGGQHLGFGEIEQGAGQLVGLSLDSPSLDRLSPPPGAAAEDGGHLGAMCALGRIPPGKAVGGRPDRGSQVNALRQQPIEPVAGRELGAGGRG
ncbi:hypothetical protein [Actinoplanes philippinensis]|uniref:hypothetical protein n=1 Tax=Actinoplanes philippinensis TaxID=35752 RepID=UPI0033CC033F